LISSCFCNGSLVCCGAGCPRSAGDGGRGGRRGARAGGERDLLIVADHDDRLVALIRVITMMSASPGLEMSSPVAADLDDRIEPLQSPVFCRKRRGLEVGSPGCCRCRAGALGFERRENLTGSRPRRGRRLAGCLSRLLHRAVRAGNHGPVTAGTGHDVNDDPQTDEQADQSKCRRGMVTLRLSYRFLILCRAGAKLPIRCGLVMNKIASFSRRAVMIECTDVPGLAVRFLAGCGSERVAPRSGR